MKRYTLLTADMANDRRARRYSGLRWRLAHSGEPN